MEDIRFNGQLNFEIKDPGFLQVQRNAMYRYPFKNGKPAYSFIFVQKGEMLYHFLSSKKKILIEKNTCLFIPKNLPYEATYLQDSTQIELLTFDVKNDDFLANFSMPIPLKNPELILLFSSISPQNRHSPLFLSAKIYELLHYLDTTANSLPKKYQKLLPALLDLKQQYFKNEKISYYAQLCSMSESNFRKLFKEYTGTSPITYRNLIRVSAVQSLLNTGEINVSEAAYLVGFNNMAFFYQTYHKHQGK